MNAAVASSLFALLLSIYSSDAWACSAFLKALREKIWTVQEVQLRINRAEEYSEKLQIPQNRLDEYEKQTGIRIEVRPQEDFFQFLKRNNLDPAQLRYIGDGMQGTIYTHPGLPGKAFKIAGTIINKAFAEFRVRKLPGPMKIEIPDWGVELPTEIQNRMASDAGFRHGMNRYLESERIMRESAGPKYAMRLASQLIELRILFDEIHMPYFDVVRIHAIGNNFFVRDFSEDSQVQEQMMRNAWKLTETQGLNLGELINPLLPEIAKHQGLSTLLHYTVLGVPQSYSSASEFALTQSDRRPRLFIIYDLD